MVEWGQKVLTSSYKINESWDATSSMVTIVNYKSEVLIAQSCVTLVCPWDSPGKNTSVGSHSLLQEISPTQGSIALQADCLWSEPQGSPSVNYAILNICKLLKE